MLQCKVQGNEQSSFLCENDGVMVLVCALPCKRVIGYSAVGFTGQEDAVLGYPSRVDC